MVILKPIQDPGQKNQYKSFSICHWNLDSTTTHGYAKLSLLKAYITVNKMDIIIICLSKTNLDSSIQSDNNNLEIPDIIQFVLIISRITNFVAFAYTAKYRCHFEPSMSAFCRKA